MNFSGNNKKIFGIFQLVLGAVISLYGLKNVMEGTRYHHMDQNTLLMVLGFGLLFLVLGYFNLMSDDSKKKYTLFDFLCNDTFFKHNLIFC